MQVAVLTTHHLDVDLAIRHLREQAAALAFEAAGVVLYTAGIKDPSRIVRAIYESLPAPMVGTKCPMLGSRTSDTNATTAMAVVMGGVTAKTGILENISIEDKKVTALDRTSSAGRFCITFPDAMRRSADSVMESIQAIIGHCPIVGGFSADDFTFDSIAQFFNGAVFTDSAPYMVVEGGFTVGISSQSGVSPISNERLPIVAVGSAIKAIGHEKAYAYYAERIGDKALFREFPILFEDPTTGRLRCRTPLSVTDDGSIVCGANVPDGARVTLGSATRENVVEAASEGVASALKSCANTARLVFAISCSARPRRLGLRADEERQAIAKSTSAPFALAYLYGEITPGDGPPCIENNHIVFLVIGSAE